MQSLLHIPEACFFTLNTAQDSIVNIKIVITTTESTTVFTIKCKEIMLTFLVLHDPRNNYVPAGPVMHHRQSDDGSVLSIHDCRLNKLA